MNIAAVGIGGEPFANREAIAAAMMEREPAVGATDCEAARSGLPAAQKMASATGTKPTQRNGVFNRPMTRRPAVISKSAPLLNSVTRPKAPGRLATHRPTAFIHSMP
jgi:hypothetical protein